MFEKKFEKALKIEKRLTMGLFPIKKGSTKMLKNVSDFIIDPINVHI